MQGGIIVDGNYKRALEWKIRVKELQKKSFDQIHSAIDAKDFDSVEKIIEETKKELASIEAEYADLNFDIDFGKKGR